MPAFYFGIIILAIFLWFCCIQYYDRLGNYLKNWFDETKEVMSRNKDNDKKE